MDFTKPHMQFTAREVRDRHGIEMTPDEVAASLNESIATIRARMVEMGYPEFAGMPDEEVYATLREAQDDTMRPMSREEAEAIMAAEPDPDIPPPTDEEVEQMWQEIQRRLKQREGHED